MASKYKHPAHWTHPSRKGELTARAKRAGLSVHEEAEKDAHTKGTSKQAKKLRSQGVLALNSQKGVFEHGKKKHGTAMKGKSAGSRRRGKKTAKRRSKTMFK